MTQKSPLNTGSCRIGMNWGVSGRVWAELCPAFIGFLKGTLRDQAASGGVDKIQVVVSLGINHGIETRITPD